MSSGKNRAYWNATSDAYQVTHGPALDREPKAWGVWRIPESELRVLGEVAGLRMLELGCGAAQWAHALNEAGASAVGIDLSEQQLVHARAASRRTPHPTPLVQGNAEQLPFSSATFDIVFSDHGATVFASPMHIVAEVSRVLKPDGLFAFCMASPFLDACFDAMEGETTSRLAADYFSLSAYDDGQSVNYQLPYGAWIRLFRQHGFIVEDLIELQPPADASTTYVDFVPLTWARRWPAEHIWKLRKASASVGRGTGDLPLETLSEASRIAFDAIPWESSAPGARQKAAQRADTRVRLVELTDAFVHDEWCTVGHAIYVLEGSLALTFDGRVDHVAEGEASLIPSGVSDRHKPRALSARVLLLVVDDAPRAGASTAP